MVRLEASAGARKRAGDLTPTMLVYSLRGPRDLMYGPELEGMSADLSAPGSAEVRLVYTRKVPDAHPRPASHLATNDIKASAAWPEPLAARVYVCGPSGFVDHATGLLRETGYPDDRIRTERFGPTGVDR